MNIKQGERMAPQLVSKKTIKKLGKIFQVPVPPETSWKDNVVYFYNDYIKPNLFALIIFAIVGIFLTIKYLLKQEKEEKKEKKRRKHKKKLAQYARQLQQENNTNLDAQNYNHIDVDAGINNNTDLVSTNSTYSSKSIDDDIYYRAGKRRMNLDYDDDDIEDRDEDEVSYYSLSKEYERLIRENDGTLTNGMIRDKIDQKRSRLTFDNLAKLVSGN